VLHGGGNGLLTIAKGTVPLAIFGPVGYGLRTGLLGAPARATQAASSLLFGLLMDQMGIGVLVIFGQPQSECVFRAADAEGKTDGCSCSGLARRDQRCQIFRDRETVAAAPAKQASPQVPKLTAQAVSCDVPPNWSSVTPNKSVPRKLAPKPMQE
jgi:hypothetical protein